MGRPSRSCHGEGNRLHLEAGRDAGHLRGKEEGTFTEPDTEQERPVLAATSGEGGSYKPTAKGNRAGRESEGFIVLTTPSEKLGRGKGPCFGRAGVWR